MARTRCPARYKNLGLETFGNKKKVTEEILTQFCKNDEWLRRNLEEVRYLTPPAVRKTMSVGETYSEEMSWGCDVGANNRVQFSNKTFDTINIDLTSDDGLSRWFDNVQSTSVRTEIKPPNAEHDEEYNIVQLDYDEVITQEEIVKKFGSGEDIGGYNAAWYVGFDKTKNFYLKPKWIKNWKKYVTSTNLKVGKDLIPAIARAQTFKVPTSVPNKSPLVKVDLRLEYNGTPTLSSSPLYVQIWKTKLGWVNVTKWDKKTKQVIKKYWKVSDHQAEFGSAPPSTWKRYEKVVTKIKYKKGKKKGQVKEKKVTYKAKKNGDYIVKRRQVYKPKPRKGKSIQSPLAEYVYDTKGKTTKGGEVTIAFNNPAKVNGGEHYAIVLLSPLNNWDNCPRWGGWGRNCNVDKNYAYGNAFVSFDNGRSWKRYGKSGKEEDIEVYRQGKYVPRDYWFRCHVRTQDEQISKKYEKEGIVYLKPIYHNPIYALKINTVDYGTEHTSSTASIQYQVSTNGDVWYDVNVSEEFNLQAEEGTPSKVVFVRAILKTTNQFADPPYIEKVSVDLFMHPANEMYVRTNPYTPEKFGTILGASVWGRVFAPYVLENEQYVSCRVDIIQKKELSEHFDIIELDLLDEKIDELGISNMEWIDTLDSSDSRCEYLTTHPEILDELKENHNIYILPYEMDGLMYNLSFAPSQSRLVDEPLSEVVMIDNQEVNLHDVILDDNDVYTEDDEIDSETVIDDNNLTETNQVSYAYPDNLGGIKLISEVAYPIISCQLEPEDSLEHGQLTSFGEWYDYTFDYQSNELKFKRDTLNRMSAGDLSVSFNPVFIKDLTNDEIGVHYDEDGNILEGLILDYFKERIMVTQKELETRKVKLRVDALDPIRQVYLYKSELDEPISLVENHDYFYDIDTHEIEFPVLTTSTNGTILELDDIVEIVYTPNLDDTSISVGYSAVRINTAGQCYLDDYYIEYKVG